MGEVAEFLRGHPPFDAATDAELAEVAATAEVETYPAGATIFARCAEVLTHLRVVHRGAVEVVHDGRVLDLLGPGELFGHSSMLSGLPPGFGAVAAEDTECYRIPANVVRPLLGGPAGLRFLTRSLLAVSPFGYTEPGVDPAQRPVGELLRAAPVMCAPTAPIREAAQRMTEAGASATVVDLGNGRLGILTDRDLRERVVAAGLDPMAPVAAAMTAPALAVASERLGGEVLLDMLDRGIRHVPVLSATGAVLGVLEDGDLVAVTIRSSFHLRRAIARADTVDALAAAAAALRPAVVDLHAAKVAATGIAGVYSVVVDALTRRLVELVERDWGRPVPAFTWLALGSFARREAVPSSDVDSALVWADGTDPDDTAATGRRARTVAERVLAGLEACGFPADRNGAVASNPLFARSVSAWRAATRSWLDDPTQEKALILVSLIVDGRPVWGLRRDPAVPDAFRLAREHPDLLRLLARFALAHRPPTGFLRDFVVEHSGKRRGQLDLKRGGLVPIADLARWAGMAAGVASGSTIARLQAAAAAGTLDAADARTLEEAFDFLLWLRLDHQVDQLRAGTPPDDHIRPADLSRVTRGSLKEVFRAVAGVQRRVSVTLELGLR
jgi:CBS domain-containing protein